MVIKLNNRNEEIHGYDSMTVQELLDYKNFTFKFLVVKVNGVNINNSQYDSQIISEGDDVVVLHLISGG